MTEGKILFRIMKVYTSTVLGFLLALITTSVEANVAPVSRSYKLYHSFQPESGVFVPRGSVTISSSSTGNGVVTDVQQEESCLSEASEDIDNLVKSGGMYSIKVVDEETSRSVITSVPGCEVRRSNFREEISLTIGHTGSLISVSYKPLVSPLAPSCHTLPSLSSSPDKQLEFQTSVSYSTATSGMTIPVVLPPMRPPPGMSWLPRAGKGSGSSSDGKSTPFVNPEEEEKNQQNQSFLRRYWHLILPVAMMVMLGGEPAPEEANGGQRPQGVNAGATGQTSGGSNVGAASQTAGGTTRQRRGKRG